MFSSSLEWTLVGAGKRSVKAAFHDTDTRDPRCRCRCRRMRPLACRTRVVQCKPRIERTNDAVEQKRRVVRETEVVLDTETTANNHPISSHLISPVPLTYRRSVSSLAPPSSF